MLSYIWTGSLGTTHAKAYQFYKVEVVGLVELSWIRTFCHCFTRLLILVNLGSNWAILHILVLFNCLERKLFDYLQQMNDSSQLRLILNKLAKQKTTTGNQSFWPGRLSAQACVQTCKCQRTFTGFCHLLMAFCFGIRNSIWSWSKELNKMIKKRDVAVRFISSHKKHALSVQVSHKIFLTQLIRSGLNLRVMMCHTITL